MATSTSAKPEAPTESPEVVVFQNERYKPIKEGLAQILTPAPKEGDKATGKAQQVFYNPVQQYNRDLSVLAIKAFAEDYAFVRENRKRHNGNGRRNKAKRNGDGQNTEKVAVVESNDTNGAEPKSLQKPASELTKELFNGEAGLGNEVQETDEQVNGESNQGTKRKRPDNSDVTWSAPEQPASKRRESHEGEKILAQNLWLDGSSDPQQHTNGKTKGGSKPVTQSGFRILDALSATGLRALRYAKEVPQATYIVANDLSKSATEAIKRNAEYNGVADKIQISTANAVDHMHHASKPISNGGSDQHYQVIDLDPYGTAAPFLDSAVRALSDGGLLCVTCTDAGVFASSAYLEKAFSQYGGSSIDGVHSHEGGIRLIIQSVATTAAKYGIAIEPVLSLSVDFYIRLFIRVHKSPAQVKFLASKSMIVHSCDHGCGAWSLQFMGEIREKMNKSGDPIFHHRAAQAPSVAPECEHCGSKTHLAGPMWGGPLHNPHFVKQILSSLPSLDKDVYGTLDRLEGMLSIALSECELHDDLTTPSAPGRSIPNLAPHIRHTHPFFVHLPSLSKVLHTSTPSEAAFRGALLGMKYKVVRSHAKAGSLATNAGWNIIWRVMREWVKQKSPIKEGSLRESMAGWRIIHPGVENPGGGASGRKRLKGKIEEVLGLKGEEAVKEGLRAVLKGLDEGEGGEGGKEVVFDEKVGRMGLVKEKGTVLYAQHPPGWGPMKRAGAD